MKDWKIKLGIVGIFVLGVIVGAVGTGMAVHFHGPEFGFSRPEQTINHILRRLTRELNLTDEQRQEIAPIVRDAFTQMRMIRNRLTPEVEALMAESTQRLKQHLNPEQQRLLDLHNAEVMRRWKQFAGTAGPPPPPPFGAPSAGTPPAK
jgi:Spy/CpxP family protein refolding chaperone